MSKLKKLKELAIDRQFNHANDLDLFLLSMFKYGNIPEPYKNKIIEDILTTYGMCGITTEGKKLIIGRAKYSGTLTDQHTHTECLIDTGVKVYKRTLITEDYGENVAIIRNNSTGTPDFDIFFTSEMLANIDVSLYLNIIFTRLMPFPVVNDEKEKEKIDQLIKTILCGGDITSFVSDNILKELVSSMGGTTQGIQTVSLTDPDKVNKIPYLSQVFLDIQQRFYTKYGHNTTTPYKKAQQNDTEVTQQDTLSRILCDDRLECRKYGIEKANKIFNLDISVDFSDAWKESNIEGNEDNEQDTDGYMGNADDQTNNDADM